MFTSVLFAALLTAAPSVLAQSASTSAFTRCTTRFGYRSASTPVPTWYQFSETTNTILITTTTRDTITVTPNATTCTSVATETSTVFTTTTSIPPPVNVPTPAGFLPLIIVAPTPVINNPTPIPRVKRLQIKALEVSHPLKRQTAPGNTGGFVLNPDGSTSNLNKGIPRRVECEVRISVATTSTITVTGVPTTVTLPQKTATAVVTTTVFTTSTITEIKPAPTIYAACAGNNVVDHITDRDGNRMNFDRVVYRPSEGFPIENELVLNTTSAVNCCAACQNTQHCAGSFFVYAPMNATRPEKKECHLRLTIAPSYNSTLPLGPTGTSTSVPFPTSTGVLGTCDRGSDSLYLGVIRGKSVADFPANVSLSFSNGPCGRFSVSPIRLPPGAKRAAMELSM